MAQTVVVQAKVQRATSQSRLEPMLLSVSFSGTLPSGHVLPIPQEVYLLLNFPETRIQPVEVSVSLPGQFSGSIKPCVRVFRDTAAEAVNVSARNGAVVITDVSRRSSTEMPSEDEPAIPFLPLPSTFDYTNRAHWEELAGLIQRWLLQDDPSHRKRQYWTWGRELFWIAFVAMYPSFPFGDTNWNMGLWHSRISLEGAFIQSWVNGGWQECGSALDDDSSEALSAAEVAEIRSEGDFYCFLLK
ncbi:hypothetical protein EW146_g3695 [Bondarzewia mesenterica]|uniref:Uncharacterized protein n=1 Tax=Bondarzewia mesenterica TaxID=1095465 RepID=A0A4S4LYM7_9AGAM|nr:hypothetical protein EW146_g3695 [Bondarzewia mesenterica]